MATHTVKHHTSTGIEAAIAAMPAVAAVSCQELCDDINNDLDTLANLGDFPVHSLGIIAAAARRDIVARHAQLKRQHCPDC